MTILTQNKFILFFTLLFSRSRNKRYKQEYGINNLAWDREKQTELLVKSLTISTLNYSSLWRSSTINGWRAGTLVSQKIKLTNLREYKACITSDLEGYTVTLWRMSCSVRSNNARNKETRTSNGLRTWPSLITEASRYATTEYYTKKARHTAQQ